MKTNELGSAIAAIIVLAGLSVAVAKNSDTANVLGTGLSGFANLIKVSQGRG